MVVFMLEDFCDQRLALVRDKATYKVDDGSP